MTTEEINIAIAEACGIVEGFPSGGSILLPYRYHNPTTGERYLNLPTYIADLNAMHEAERSLDFATQGESYWRNLATVVVGGDDDSAWEIKFCIATATAAQRAEAFLRTLGKWKE